MQGGGRRIHSVEALPALCEATTSVEPGDRRFDNPAFGQNYEAVHAVGLLDDLDLSAAQDTFEAALEGGPW